MRCTLFSSGSRNPLTVLYYDTHLIRSCQGQIPECHGTGSVKLSPLFEYYVLGAQVLRCLLIFNRRGIFNEDAGSVFSSPPRNRVNVIQSITIRQVNKSLTTSASEINTIIADLRNVTTDIEKTNKQVYRVAISDDCMVHQCVV